VKIDRLTLGNNDWVPNNPRLPVIIYRQAVDGSSERSAELFEKIFERHGWRPDWRDGIFDYHHYHSTAHEALGVFAGSATLELGGPKGHIVDVEAGDALFLPTGTGHRSMVSDPDFQVVGAYPRGQSWDICRTAPDREARKRMESLPDPDHDPLTGSAVIGERG
jgi:uncharacterized protein YjlB